MIGCVAEERRARPDGFLLRIGEAPQRCKAEFQRTGLRVSMLPVYDEQLKPFYRATVTASLPGLAGTSDLRFPTVDRSGTNGR